MRKEGAEALGSHCFFIIIFFFFLFSLLFLFFCSPGFVGDLRPQCTWIRCAGRSRGDHHPQHGEQQRRYVCVLRASLSPLLILSVQWCVSDFRC